MSLNVVFTAEANETLQAITVFIRIKWGDRAAEKFKLSAIKTIKTIALQPYMFKASVIDTNVRQGLITKQTSLLYEVRDEYILILYFWDNRQDPLIYPNS